MEKSPETILSITVQGHEVGKLEIYKFVGHGYHTGVFNFYKGKLRVGGQTPIESGEFYHVAQLKAWAVDKLTIKFTEL